MRIIDRYIIKNFLISFFYCLTLFVFLYIIIDLFGHLDEILRHRVPLLMLQEYYLSMIPFIMLHTTPVSALISTIYLMSSMNRYDEISALQATGVNMLRILAPFLVMGLIISMSVFIISERLLPLSMKNVQGIRERFIEKGPQDKGRSHKTIETIAMYGKNDRLIFIKSYDAYNKIATGITILQQDKNGNVIEKINAQRARWTGLAWVFSSVLFYRLGEQGMILGSPSFFEEKDIAMEDPEELMTKGAYYEFMDFKNLSSYIQNFSNTSPDIIMRLKVDLHQKISLPFANLIVILIGSAFATNIRRRGKTTTMVGIGASMAIGFVYYAIMASSIALGKGGILPPFLSAHLANILFGSIGIILIRD